VIEEPLPPVQANEGMLVQIMANLLSNALKFVAISKIPKVRIYGETTNGTTRILVEDNGIGIDPSHRERIFSVFERLHGQEQYSGTGIGLAIVKKGIERMNGSVAVDSMPNGGTRFEIQLPAAEARQG
jgi:signal transduction histidine kinase